MFILFDACACLFLALFAADEAVSKDGHMHLDGGASYKSYL